MLCMQTVSSHFHMLHISTADRSHIAGPLPLQTLSPMARVQAYLQCVCHQVNIAARRIVLASIAKDELHIYPELVWVVVLAHLNFILDCVQVHRGLNHFEVVRVLRCVYGAVKGERPLQGSRRWQAVVRLLKLTWWEGP